MGEYKEILDLLVCPATHQPLHEAPNEAIQTINSLINQRTLKTVAGLPVETEIDAGLMRSDGNVMYPVRNGIPHLLTDNGILIPEQLRASLG